MNRATRRWRSVIVLAATVVGVAVAARLGAWQLGRAAQKESMQASLDARSVLPVVETTDLARTAVEAAEQQHRRVRLRGKWLPERTVFLDNRQMNGRPGFVVVTPLQLADEQGAVLVQRGWAPRDMRERSAVPVVPSAAGVVEVVGNIAAPPSRLYEFSPDSSGAIRQNLDVVAFSRESGLALRPLSILQVDSDASTADGLLRQWSRPALDVHKNYGYAFQWFGLGALMAGLYVWFQLVRPRLRRRA